MNYINRISFVMVISLSILALSLPVRAADESPLAKIIANPDSADRCVDLNSVDHTDIIDNGFILFYMRNKKIYLNALPQSCPGLKSADSFMYRVPVMRLCNVDLITVLEHFGGEFYPGPTCGLGLFYPIDRDTAQQLTKRSK